MNVVYIKHFDNGKKYIGITKHFEKRMKEHERAKDNLLVHNAMKKHKHYTEIVFESEEYSDVIEMEKIIIQNYIDLGYNIGEDLYNMTLGGEPLAPYNKEDVLNIIETIKLFFPDKDIWLWTGYNEDEINIKELKDNGLDVLICGRYEEDKKINGRYFGSSNQKMIKLKEMVYNKYNL